MPYDYELLAFDWLHSVDKNHYYVMLLLSQGCHLV
jgi:hypothetical protein